MNNTNITNQTNMNTTTTADSSCSGTAFHCWWSDLADSLKGLLIFSIIFICFCLFLYIVYKTKQHRRNKAKKEANNKKGIGEFYIVPKDERVFDNRLTRFEKKTLGQIYEGMYWHAHHEDEEYNRINREVESVTHELYHWFKNTKGWVEFLHNEPLKKKNENVQDAYIRHWFYVVNERNPRVAIVFNLSFTALDALESYLEQNNIEANKIERVKNDRELKLTTVGKTDDTSKPLITTYRPRISDNQLENLSQVTNCDFNDTETDKRNKFISDFITRDIRAKYVEIGGPSGNNRTFHPWTTEKEKGVIKRIDQGFYRSDSTRDLRERNSNDPAPKAEDLWLIKEIENVAHRLRILKPTYYSMQHFESVKADKSNTEEAYIRHWYSVRNRRVPRVAFLNLSYTAYNSLLKYLENNCSGDSRAYWEMAQLNVSELSFFGDESQPCVTTTVERIQFLNDPWSKQNSKDIELFHVELDDNHAIERQEYMLKFINSDGRTNQSINNRDTIAKLKHANGDDFVQSAPESVVNIAPLKSNPFRSFNPLPSNVNPSQPSQQQNQQYTNRLKLPPIIPRRATKDESETLVVST